VVGLTGASGTRLGVRLLELLRPTPVETHVVMCSCARRGIPQDTGRSAEEVLTLADRSYGEWNQAARISSGSFLTLGMVVAPCSRRSLASIALGYANTLIHRAADVTMKEGRPLVLLVHGPALAGTDARHVARLETVPGVRVQTADHAADDAEIDAEIARALEGFRLPSVPVRG